MLMMMVSISYAKNFTYQKLPSLELKDLKTAQTVTLNQLPKPPYVLHFWATWCADCEADERAIEQLAKKYPVVAVLVRDNLDDTINWLDTDSDPYVMVLDDKEAAFTQNIGIEFLPTTLLIDVDQRVKIYAEGNIKDVNKF